MFSRYELEESSFGSLCNEENEKMKNEKKIQKSLRLQVFILALLVGVVAGGACKDKKAHSSGSEQAASEGKDEESDDFQGSGQGENGEKGKGHESENSTDKSNGIDTKDPDSLTGIKLCDDYLNKVCACAKKRPALDLACERGRSSAPKWKASAEKDPSSKKIVEASCRNALDELKENFHCQ